MRTAARFRLSAALLTLLAVTAIAVAGCGGSKKPDPKQTLGTAFSPDGIGKLKSGNLDVEMKLGEAEGGDPTKNLTLSLKGPFDDQTANFTATAGGVNPTSGKPVTFQGGLTITPSDAFVNYQGTEYDLGAQRFAQLKQAQASAPHPTPTGDFKSNFQTACKAALAQTGSTGSACDGLDPSSWVTFDFDGTDSVDGTDTNHFTGNLDLNKIFSGLSALSQASGSQSIPPGIFEAAPNFIESTDLDLYTGKDDNIPRKGEFQIKVNVLGQEVDLDTSATVADANQPQTISAPGGAQPIENLRGRLPQQLQGPFDCILGAKDISGIQACATQLQGLGQAAAGATNLPL